MSTGVVRILQILAEFAIPDSRAAAASELARELACEDVMFFGPDPEIDTLLPAPGLRQTLPRATEWHRFLKKCTVHGEASGSLPISEEQSVSARGVAANGPVVAILLGAQAHEAETDSLATVLPLLGSLFVSERRADALEVRVAAAGMAVERASALSKTLQGTRDELESTLIEAEEARREAEGSRAAMDAFYDALPIPAAMVEPDLRFRRVNQSLIEAYGLSAEEIIGRSLSEVVPSYADQVEGYYQEVLRTGQPLRNVELAIPDRTGNRTRHYLANYFPITVGEGEVGGVGVVGLDVTDRHLAEEASREHARTVETLERVGHTLAAELDLENLVQAVTDAGTELTGAQFGAFFYNQFDAEGEAYTLYTISGVPREAFSKFPMPSNTPVFAPTFYGQGVVRSPDITKDPRYGRMGPHYGMPAGHLPVRSYLAVPVISRNGEVFGGLFFGHEEEAVFTDRHERLAVGIASWASVAMDNARLFDAEHRARAEAERANRAKSDFLAVMSHELRTPLNAILGYADLLMMGVAEISEDANQKVDRIRLSAHHLLELINEVLTFARLEAGEEKVMAEEVPLAEVISDAALLVEPLALTKSLEFDYQVPSGSTILYSDARKIRQILVNLLTNAVKFTDEGQVALATNVEGNVVRFEVRDSGPGIPPEDQEHLFDPFWQADNSATRRAGGTGLGLSVTRRLASLLGGEISVQSSVGSGSTFTVRLPLTAPGLGEDEEKGD